MRFETARVLFRVPFSELLTLGNLIRNVFLHALLKVLERATVHIVLVGHKLGGRCHFGLESIGAVFIRCLHHLTLNPLRSVIIKSLNDVTGIILLELLNLGDLVGPRVDLWLEEILLLIHLGLHPESLKPFILLLLQLVDSFVDRGLPVELVDVDDACTASDFRLEGALLHLGDFKFSLKSFPILTFHISFVRQAVWKRDHMPCQSIGTQRAVKSF